ncbi:MAG: PspC domain-containing protein [Chloroflexi bacterium]|nr:PspC domain-containing protein [Chloroflexota bacterium]
MSEKRLTRSSDDQMVAGVCAGLADYFGIDPVIVRALFVIVGFAGGSSVLVYLVLWLIMPEA